jgi:hypothetical protein
MSAVYTGVAGANKWAFDHGVNTTLALDLFNYGTEQVPFL